MNVYNAGIADILGYQIYEMKRLAVVLLPFHVHAHVELLRKVLCRAR